jgi:hypothetical protein
MSAAGYSINTGGWVALAAATAKTVLGVKAHANSGLQAKKLILGFDGVTASAVPTVVELMRCDGSTNFTIGTANTDISSNITQKYGRVIAAQFTAGKTWTSEPTVLTPIDGFPLTPNAGLVVIEFPLGQEPDCDLSKGLVIRITAPAIVNVYASMDVERI